MKSYPLILTAPLVRAALDGSKTQHRVPIKPQPAQVERWAAGMPTNMTDAKHTVLRGPDGRGWACCGPFRCPFGVPGDTLYVKESHAWVDYLVGSELDDPVCVAFKADQTAYSFAGGKPVKLDTYAWPWDRIKWRSPALMPRWASRLTLAVESVRVQRVQDISEEDARAEGMPWSDGNPGSFGPRYMVVAAQNVFRHSWYAKHGADSWTRNDWVFALTFKCTEGER